MGGHAGSIKPILVNDLGYHAMSVAPESLKSNQFSSLQARNPLNMSMLQYQSLALSLKTSGRKCALFYYRKTDIDHLESHVSHDACHHSGPQK